VEFQLEGGKSFHIASLVVISSSAAQVLGSRRQVCGNLLYRIVPKLTPEILNQSEGDLLRSDAKPSSRIWLGSFPGNGERQRWVASANRSISDTSMKSPQLGVVKYTDTDSLLRCRAQSRCCLREYDGPGA
jgi:hypothetical protein